MKRFYKISFYFLLFTFHYALLPAQQLNIDSLYKVLKTEHEDTNKIKTLNYLANREYKRSRYPVADSLAQCALKLSESLKYPLGAGNAYITMAGTYLEMSNYSGALNCDMLGAKKFDEANSEASKGKAYGAMGSLYNAEGNYPLALKYMLMSLKTAEKYNDMYSVGIELGNIGLVYNNMGDYANAMKYYHLALAPKEKSGNIRGVSNTWDNIGVVYDALGKYDSAKAAEIKAIDLGKATQNRYGLCNEYSDLGLIYFNEKNYDEALKYQLMSVVIGKEIEDKEDLCTTYRRLGFIYLKQKNAGKAKAYFDTAFALAENIGSKAGKRDTYLGKYALDSLTGNSAAALADYKNYTAWRDSLKNEQTSRELLSEQMTYDFDRKQAIEKAREDKKITLEEDDKKKQVAIRNFFIIGFALTLALVFFVFRGYRQKQKDNAVITRQKEEMERLSIVARETDNLVLIMAADGTIEWANESFSRINGISLDDVKKQKGNTIYEISNNPNIKSIIDTAVKERRSVVYESMNDKKEGARQWESSTLTPIFASDGKLHKLIIVDADITLRKIAEETIREKNKDILDSIAYAKRLQDAILPPESMIKEYFPESFVLYKPKDIVAGDFYWMEVEGDTVLLAACDCTGHGVPGAIVSVVCSNALNRALNEFNIRETGKVLDKVREIVLETFGKSEGEVKDGMDCSFCAINTKTKKVEWSGAYNPLWYVENGEMKEITGDKQPIGKTDNPKPFTTHTLSLPIAIGTGSTLYLFTDGYADQFGGPKGKKFKYQQLKDKLFVISSQPMQEQKRILEQTLEEWKGELEQVDDILIIGIRV